MKRAKTTLLLFLCVISVFFGIPTYAEGEEAAELSIISANVSGLPSFLSKYDRDVQASQKTLGEMLNKSGYDIICVQEDFGYHDTLAATMTDYPYQTYTSGGVPVGDGLNVFSKYRLYNVERVAWDENNGVFSDGADELTPKGFIKCTVDADGVLIDLYNVHGDSYRTDADQLAKKAQLCQLVDYIEKNSAQRPIVITGDTNLTFHNDPLSEMYRILISEGGFTDTWVEVKNNGNYMQSVQDLPLIKSWYDKFGGHDWGRWDSVERVLYRNGDGVKLTPTRFEYVIYTDREDEIKALTDHRMMECVLSLSTSDYDRPDITLTEMKKPSMIYGFFHGALMLTRCASILIIETILLYPTASIAAALGSAAAVTVAVTLAKRRKKKKNNS